MDPRVFFPLGPPPFAPPPPDHALEIRILKLAEFAARNGPAFVEEVRAKQCRNPEYAFLHGGEGAAYFFWVLHCNLLGQHPHQPAALQPPPSVGQATVALPPQVRSGWSQVLSLLNGSKESITTSQAWFMACAPYAAGMAEMLLASASTAAAAGNYTAALHMLWLVNDILFKAKSTRPHAQNTITAHSGDVDPIAAALKPYLGHLLRRVYLAAGGDVEKQQAVAKVAHIWSEREVYPSQMVEVMVMEMMGLAAAAGQQQPPPQFPPPPPIDHHCVMQQQQHPRPPFPSGPGMMPHTMHTQPLPPPGAPPHLAYRGEQQPKRPPPPPSEPEEQPFDPFSFPPGLIPHLVEENLQSQIPYSPLNPENISASEVPLPPTLDPYLKARLDKFYAQLDGYRAGVDFSEIEGGGEPPIQRGNNNSVDNIKTHGVPTTTHRGGGVDDGSGGFRATDGGRGLGYGDVASEGVNDDVFSSYRAMRSQGYHSGITTRSVKTRK
ncbi:hypothetical protein Ndes2526B_g01714 [Nannochloris sp. 'desiccata']|nr:hypothetical protein NADE_002482 [Chlorella desiccata (nom. nud.)]